MSEGSSELLDELDLRILRALSEDARRSCREVAEKLQVTSGTVYNRIKRMMDKGVIEGYIPLVDPTKLGYDLTTLILAQVDHKQLLEIEERLVKLEYVNAIYDITGEFDIAVIARVKDRETLNDLVKKILHIPGVNRTVTNVVFDVVKEDFRVKI